jgi:hypothetical protein
MKNVDKVDGDEIDKTELFKLYFLMDSDNPTSENLQNFAIFKDT